jgi:hypothetical protein
MSPCPLGIGADAHEDGERPSALFCPLSSLPISVLGIRLRSSRELVAKHLWDEVAAILHRHKSSRFNPTLAIRMRDRRYAFCNKL